MALRSETSPPGPPASRFTLTKLLSGLLAVNLLWIAGLAMSVLVVPWMLGGSSPPSPLASLVIAAVAVACLSGAWMAYRKFRRP